MALTGQPFELHRRLADFDQVAVRVPDIGANLEAVVLGLG